MGRGLRNRHLWRIAGVVFDVPPFPRLVVRAGGEYEHRKNQITIQQGLSPLDEANTLLHEILHGVAYINSLTQTGQPLDSENKEEVVINTITNGLAQVFRDNKWLLPYFIKKFK